MDSVKILSVFVTTQPLIFFSLPLITHPDNSDSYRNRDTDLSTTCLFFNIVLMLLRGINVLFILN